MPRLSLCASIILCLHIAVSTSHAEEPSTESELSFQLRKIPGVHSVTSTPTKSKPKKIIIHSLNWHFLSKEDYTADPSDSLDGKFPEAEIEKQHYDFLDDVEAIEKEQSQILRYLIKKHKVQSMYLKGLTEKILSAFNSFVKTLPFTNSNFARREGDINLSSL